MNLKTIYNKITGDIRAVSPVVATLVLIVVAIVGASAVGVMTGAFADNVDDQNVDTTTAGRTLIVSGSTTVYPVAKELARGYMEANPGVRIITQSVGSGIGIAAVGRDVIDIGMASRDVRAAEFAANPGIVGRVVHIGNSTVLLVANPSITLANLDNITRLELHNLFVNDSLTNDTLGRNLTRYGVTRGVFRLDRSGTGDVFAEVVIGAGATPLGHDRIHALPNANVTFADGNALVLAEIMATPGAIGGIDIGFVPATGIVSSTNATLRELRPLNLITNGEPSALEQSFIDFARTPGARVHFRAVGVRSLHFPPY